MTGSDTQCCGTAAYNPDVYFCCNNKVQVGRAAGMECCNNTKMYNKNNEICCNQRVHTKGTTVQCCGLILYDSNRELCCENTVKLRNGIYTSCCGITPYNAAFNSGIQCCGNKQTFNTKLSFCCRGSPVFHAFKASSACA